MYTLLNYSTTGSDNCPTAVQRQEIIWTNPGLLPIEPLRTQTSLRSESKYYNFLSRKWIWKCLLRNEGQSISSSVCRCVSQWLLNRNDLAILKYKFNIYKHNISKVYTYTHVSVIQQLRSHILFSNFSLKCQCGKIHWSCCARVKE